MQSYHVVAACAGYTRNANYGGWLGFGLVEEIWKGSLRRLSERSR